MGSHNNKTKKKAVTALKAIACMSLCATVLLGAGCSNTQNDLNNQKPDEAVSGYVTTGDKPNILLIMADVIGPRLGAYGDSVAITPVIDQLAKEGVTYTNCYTTSGVCSPSRTSFITGVNQQAVGGQHMRVGDVYGGYYATPDENIKAFLEYLRANGYYTANVTKLDYQFSDSLPSSDPSVVDGPFTIWDNDNAVNHWRASKGSDKPFFMYLNMKETHETRIKFPGMFNKDNPNLITAEDITEEVIPDYVPCIRDNVYRYGISQG